MLVICTARSKIESCHDWPQNHRHAILSKRESYNLPVDLDAIFPSFSSKTGNRYINVWFYIFCTMEIPPVRIWYLKALKAGIVLPQVHLNISIFCKIKIVYPNLIILVEICNRRKGLRPPKSTILFWQNYAAISTRNDFVCSEKRVFTVYCILYTVISPPYCSTLRLLQDCQSG